MKKILSQLYTALCHFALAFSGIIIFFWLSFPTQTSYIDHSNLTVFFRFALAFGISSVLFALPRNFPYAIKVVLHFIVNAIMFILTIANVGESNQLRTFIVVAFFTFVYAVVFGIVKGIGAIVKINEESKKIY